MKNRYYFFLAFALSVVLFIGCNGNRQTDSVTHTAEVAATISADYSGVYKFHKEGKDFNLTMTITKEKDGYRYYLTGEHYDQEGIAIIEINDETYITFDGPIGNNKPKTVSGQIEGNVILIQNYGNSMNEYHFFVECDEKYMEFVRQ
jgi:hypothetical protein